MAKPLIPDALWAEIAPLLPPPRSRPKGGRPPLDDRNALAGILFVISPLTTMGAGWPAASFDQLYVLFLLLAAAAIPRVPADGMSIARAAWMVLATTAALLAKETAIVAPGVVLLIAYLSWAANPMRFSWRPFAMAFIAVLIPVVAYLAFRAPAIAASFAGHADPAYTPDSGNAVDNAWHFFAFPFRLKLVEMSAAVFRSPWQPLAATAAHLLLVAALVRSFGCCPIPACTACTAPR